MKCTVFADGMNMVARALTLPKECFDSHVIIAVPELVDPVEYTKGFYLKMFIVLFIIHHM